MAVQLTKKNLLEVLRRCREYLVDIVLPAQCISCFEVTGTPDVLCAPCWQKLAFIDAPLCDRLGIPFAYDPGAGIISAKALANPPKWHRTRASVEYNDLSRRVIHALKYFDRHEVSQMMAMTMQRVGQDLLEEADLIIPVPLYSLRLWQRRFNQAGILAKRVAEAENRKFCSDILLRTRATRQQVGLKGSERRSNVKGAFQINQQKITDLDNKNVVLVDDVITTGATVSACSEVLLSAGCHRVDVLAFALVNNPLRPNI